jgi:hypothetical protein
MLFGVVIFLLQFLLTEYNTFLYVFTLQLLFSGLLAVLLINYMLINQVCILYITGNFYTTIYALGMKILKLTS